MIISEFKRNSNEDPVIQLCEITATGTRYLLSEHTLHDMRMIIAWVKTNHPEIIQDIVCEDCPEVC